MHQVSSGRRRSPLGSFGRGVLFEPAGDGADEVLSADFALPVVGFAAGGAVGSDVVGGFLEDDFGHCVQSVQCGKRRVKWERT